MQTQISSCMRSPVHLVVAVLERDSASLADIGVFSLFSISVAMSVDRTSAIWSVKPEREARADPNLLHLFAATVQVSPYATSSSITRGACSCRRVPPPRNDRKAGPPICPVLLGGRIDSVLPGLRNVNSPRLSLKDRNLEARNPDQTERNLHERLEQSKRGKRTFLVLASRTNSE